MADVKFCGLTRDEDAQAAVDAGARYVGAILVGGPRLVSPERASSLFDAARSRARAAGRDVGGVAVVGHGTPQELAALGTVAAADALQLHADPDAATVQAVRASFPGEVWAVMRVRDGVLPAQARELFAAADAVVLDAWHPGGLGGTGTTLPWSALAAAIVDARGASAARVVLAGGLRPENVAEARDALAPDVLDVSSGVERAPGEKDHERLRAFARAAGLTLHET